MALSVVKYVEYNDNGVWKPIVWYSNKKDNEYESEQGGDGLFTHTEIFDNSFEEFTKLIEESHIYNRGLPSDVSDYVKSNIERHTTTFYGVSHYYLSEMNDMIENEEKSLISELKNGIEVKLYDTIRVLDSMLNDKINYKKKIDELKHMYVVKINTIDQLKYIQSIVTKLVYEVRGFASDDKIRVVFYYR